MVITVVWIVLIFVTCERKISNAKIETINGIKHIYCTETPLYPKKTIAFEEELTIGEQDEEGQIQLYKPSHYAVDVNNNMYISDSSDQSIKVFDRNGKYQTTIGGKGNGPGEFQSISHIDFLPDGRLLITDWESKRISFFSTQGEFIKSTRLHNYHFMVYLTTNSSFTVDENTYGERTQRFIKTFDFTGKELVSYGEFTPSELKILRKGSTTFGIDLPYDTYSIFASDQQRQWLYHCLNDKFLIEVYDHNGKLFRKIERPYKPVPFTSKDREEYLSSQGKDPDSVFAKMAKDVELPKIKTITEHLLVDDQGNLWVETFEKKTIENRTFTAYDIFDKDGFYAARVWCDIRPGLFKRGKMYRRIEDEETGIRIFKRYRVIWKDEN